MPRSKMVLMHFSDEVKQKIDDELARGAAARSGGMEGRARVCARRAAGAAVRAYLELTGESDRAAGLTAYDLLAALPGMAHAPEAARRAALLLLERVDENYALPPEIDLLAEARRLVDALENQGTD